MVFSFISLLYLCFSRDLNGIYCTLYDAYRLILMPNDLTETEYNVMQVVKF